MKKPIVRWTIGDVSKEGFVTLYHSVKNFINLYKDNFEYFICYNNITEKQLNIVKNFPIVFINQHNYINELKLNPICGNPCWKLYPPRLDLNRHEIFIDNDLIIYKKIPIIDNFLNKNNLLFISEAIMRSYGNFLKYITISENLNTGIFGLYPNFDFKLKINNIIEDKKIIKWSNHLDEQGLVSLIFQNYNFELIDLNQIYVCHKSFKLKKGKYGIHFVGLNNKKFQYIDAFKQIFFSMC